MGESNTPSQTVLDETPGRALAFLRGIGTTPLLRTILAAHGYTDAEHGEGWRLLHVASGYEAKAPPSAFAGADPVITSAIHELDASDEKLFLRVRAALRRKHPEQEAFVFAGGLAASTGAGSILSVATLLGRLDALASGKGREKSTHKADQAALVTLGERGIDAKERARLAALVTTAQKGTKADTAGATAPATPAVDPAREQHTADLTALRAWFDDWADTARSLITRRDYLIRLGLARRRKKEKPEPTVAAAPAA